MYYKQLVRLSSQILLVSVFSNGLASVGQSQGLARLSESSRVSTQGLGGVKIGMTLAQAARAAKIKLIPTERDPRDRQATCLYYRPAGKPSGVGLMVVNGIIARIDITNPRITTLSGAKVGDIEDRIRAIYGDKIHTEPHKYVERGHYLIYIPKDNPDQGNRIVFETDGRKVVRWRVGRVEEVGWVEGCL